MSLKLSSTKNFSMVEQDLEETLIANENGYIGDTIVVDFDKNFENLLSPEVYYLSASILFVIWVMGTIGNFVVLYLIYKHKELQTAINMFLVNLAVYDFIMAAIGSPFPFIAAYQREWPFGRTMCTVYGFVMAVGGIGSITTLMVLSFERYLLISRPFPINGLALNQVMWIIVSIWIYTFILTIPPLLGWGSYDFEGPRISCSIGWEAGDKMTNSYIIFLFLMGLVVPLIVIIFSSSQIIRTIRMASSQQSGVASRAEVHVIIMIGVMIGAFLIAWTPYSIVSILVTLGVTVSPSVAIVPALVAKSSTCYNPIIYAGLNTQFRKAWKVLFGFHETPASGRENETMVTRGSGVTISHVNATENVPNSICPTSSFTTMLKDRNCQTTTNESVADENEPTPEELV